MRRSTRCRACPRRNRRGAFPLLPSRWSPMIPRSRSRSSRPPHAGSAARSARAAAVGSWRWLAGDGAARPWSSAATGAGNSRSAGICFYRVGVAAATAPPERPARRGQVGSVAGLLVQGAGAGHDPARRLGRLVHRRRGAPPGSRAGRPADPPWRCGPSGRVTAASGGPRRAEPPGGVAAGRVRWQHRVDRGYLSRGGGRAPRGRGRTPDRGERWMTCRGAAGGARPSRSSSPPNRSPRGWPRSAGRSPRPIRTASCCVLGLLKGSFIFLATWSGRSSGRCRWTSWWPARYGDGDGLQRQRPAPLRPRDRRSQGKHILLVEDIIDSGKTLQRLWRCCARGSRRAWRSAPCSTSRSPPEPPPELRFVGIPGAAGVPGGLRPRPRRELPASPVHRGPGLTNGRPTSLPAPRAPTGAA